ncbi:MAG: hypothetical protein MPEBLZ_03135 [Candidatus Methanoperedens nitroreducens]|uniref:Uncharacterized protein n=1 Tax=Candidatus Methanoperedens nitratireducens TaxID=1392998 RepID=A0A0P8ADR1_9EURY|nr:MAG: hypothetical protein MPEBLZ_03135 [Candidatus Methanoperedens sp. BLZ1]
MGDAITFSTSQVGVIGLMMIGISFSGIVATEIISSNSFQSLAGQFSATRLGIEMAGTSKQPASMIFIGGLFNGKEYTIESDGAHLLTLNIIDKDDQVYDTTSMATNAKLAYFKIDSRDFDSRFQVNIIPTPDGVMLSTPKEEINNGP